MTSLVFRAVALVIAIGGVIDPSFTIDGHARARVSVVLQEAPTLELPAGGPVLRQAQDTPSLSRGERTDLRLNGGPTRRDVAERVRAQLTNDLGGDYDVQPRLTSDAAAAIVIGDSYPRPLASPPYVVSGSSRATPVATVTVAGDLSPNVRIVRVDALRDVPAGTAIRVGVDVEGAGVGGQTSTVVARVGGLEVGRASHVWRGDRDRWHADIDAVPVGEPPFAVRVEALPLDAERTAVDNAADALVDVRRTPLRVQVYEPRPSWATTFVRRALEDDGRFQVAGLSATSKSIATRSGDARTLTDAALAGFDVVIVGGLELLTAVEAHALERFMREREGAVVLVPDENSSIATGSPALDLARGLTLTGRLSETPEKLTSVAPLAPIQASELLLMSGEPPLTERLVSTSGANPAAVVVSMPRGGGRLVVSGALDAWRFRTEDGNAFDRFWQSTIAGLALAVPPPIEVSVEPSIVKPGEQVDVVVGVRSGAGLKGPPNGRGAERSVQATVDGHPIRLWPDAEAGVFRGSFMARDTDRRSTVVAQMDGTTPLSVVRPLVVSRDARAALPASTAPLSLLSASHQGIDVTPENLGDIERFVRRSVTPPAARVTRHPMRSGWWMLPFAACLSAEWYLRRRRGLR